MDNEKRSIEDLPLSAVPPEECDNLNHPSGVSPTWLLSYRKDIYSQTGEDGVIRRILDLLPTSDQCCVEVGAWDGYYLSNTRNLIENHGYRAVLIEADPTRYGELCKNYKSNSRVIPLNRRVGTSGESALDQLLENTRVPTDFDFLSIDIDGDDYHVWHAMDKYTPKTICIEFNPTIPTGLRFVQEYDSSRPSGASLCSLVDLGKEKGYELVCVLAWNAIFVRRELYTHYHISDNHPRILRADTSKVTQLFSGYDGTIYIQGSCRLPWHRIEVRESNLQQMPKWLRKPPARYNRVERVLYRFYWLLNEPRRNVHRIARKLARIFEGSKA